MVAPNEHVDHVLLVGGRCAWQSRDVGGDDVPVERPKLLAGPVFYTISGQKLFVRGLKLSMRHDLFQHLKGAMLLSFCVCVAGCVFMSPDQAKTKD